MGSQWKFINTMNKWRYGKTYICCTQPEQVRIVEFFLVGSFALVETRNEYFTPCHFWLFSFFKPWHAQFCISHKNLTVRKKLKSNSTKSHFSMSFQNKKKNWIRQSNANAVPKKLSQNWMRLTGLKSENVIFRPILNIKWILNEFPQFAKNKIKNLISLFAYLPVFSQPYEFHKKNLHSNNKKLQKSRRLKCEHKSHSFMGG